MVAPLRLSSECSNGNDERSVTEMFPFVLGVSTSMGIGG
jgi:hypothetical protein